MKLKKTIYAALALGMFAASGLSSYADTDYKRISGSDRYVTSIETQKYADSDVAVFASGKNFADALSSMNVVNAENAKLVLVNGNEDMSNFVKENGIKKAYIIGGQSSISEDFSKSLENAGAEVQRYDGADRFETNKKTLEATNYKDVAMVDGRAYPDALSSSRFIREKNLGILLYGTGHENGNENYNINYIIGGKNSVPVESGERISGSNRYETSFMLANKTEAKNLVFVSGENFADALSAINISNAKDADIILLSRSGNKDVKPLIEENEVFVVGGVNSVTDASVKNTFEGKNESTEKVVSDKISDNCTIEKIDGKSFIVDKNGEKVDYSKTEKGLFKIGDKAYALNSDGSILTGWVRIYGKVYYSELPNGLVRGWKKIDGAYRYFQPYDYDMLRNGVRSTGRNAYWFDGEGKIKTGVKPSGYRKKGIRWYAPSQSEYNNSWLTEAKPKFRFKSQAIANFAASFDGLPFKWYGCDLRDKSGVYCCGSVYSAYKEFGVKIPGSEDCNMYGENGFAMVRAQYLKAHQFGGRYIPTDFNQLIAGDLPYSSMKPGVSYNHAAIYMGKNGKTPMYIHATLADGYIVEPASIVQTWGWKNINTIRYDNVMNK